MERDIREVIIQALRQRSEGYTISELAEKLKTSRHTIALTFAYLEGAGKVTIRHVGMAKLYCWHDASSSMTKRKKEKKVRSHRERAMNAYSMETMRIQ